MARRPTFGSPIGHGVAVSSAVDDDAVHAAGVVLLGEVDGQQSVLAVHRPHRQDWSLPKGKLEPGEHVISAAVRECDEETGQQIVLGARLPSQRYVAMDRPKLVDYWVATSARDEGFIPHDEIDDIRWLPVEQMRQTLTYPPDADLVERAIGMTPTSPLVVLRHTQAVKRSDFKGKVDADRPLSGRGRSQAKALVSLLEAFGVVEVFSSPSTRCHQSVRRLAKALSMPVLHDDAFSEEGHERDSQRTAQHAKRLLRNPAPLVVSTHRPVLPTVLDSLRTHARVADDIDGSLWDPKMPPGGFIVLHRAFDAEKNPRIVSVERHRVTIDE